jgi:hypothetical protein
VSCAGSIAHNIEAEAPVAPSEHFYDTARKEYLKPRNDGGWLSLTEAQMARHLRAAGYRNKPDRGESVSPVEAALNWMQLHACVDYAGPLSGYRAGKHQMQGRPILVTSSPQLVQPAAGNWLNIEHLLKSLLEQREHPQVDTFLGWTHVFLVSLYDQKARPGQAVVFAGQRDCGKSLLQNLITQIFGGRCAKPFQAAMGQTQFNADLFAAEHLMIEDEAASTDLRARRTVGAFIKGVAANETQRLHAKNRDALILEPAWRLTASVNDEPENLVVLPPLDESLQDKIILFKCSPPAKPFNDGTPDGRREYMALLRAELPAFVHYLLSWKIPKELQCPRYGIKAFHHPAVLAAVGELSAEVQLLTFIDSSLQFTGSGTWTGTAEELESELRADYKGKHEINRLLNFPRAVGTYLGRLAGSHPKRVKRLPRGTNDRREWRLYSEEAAAVGHPGNHIEVLG